MAEPSPEQQLRAEVERRRTAEEALRRANADLEARVRVATLELRMVNDLLRHELAERARAEQELRRSNAELEQFAYVASHDLQEPLRMVASYLQLLERRYKGALDASADEFIGFAVDGAKRMQRLIEDLLTYSRLGRGGAFEPVDVEALVGEVVADLRATIEECRAEVRCGALPVVVADRAQLRQLLQNLLANALKFRRDEPPRVRVDAEPIMADDRSGWQFSVSDNGIGIPPEYRERIFGIFQRLHGRDEYPGSGIGLALARKIVERHGGRIWVDETPGGGTTICFTIVDRPEAD